MKLSTENITKNKHTEELIILISLVSICIGTILLIFVYKDISILIFISFFLAIGLASQFIPGTHNSHAVRAFLLSFGLCVLLLGAGSLYNTIRFDTVITGLDVELFYELSSEGMTVEEFEDYNVESPLPVMVWRMLYNVSRDLDLGQEPYIGVLLNALLVGLSGSFLVRLGEWLFGPDDNRLDKLVLLYGFCGICWLFGSLFLRDSFALFCNTILFWSMVRFLVKPSIRNFIVLIIVVGIVENTMPFIRVASTPFIFAITILFLISWARINRAKFEFALITFMLLTIVIIAIVVFRYQLALIIRTVYFEFLQYSSYYYATGEGLGSKLIISQPMPIRAVLGSYYLLIFPIPFWANISTGDDYHLIKMWQSIYMIATGPLYISGLFIVFKRSLPNNHYAGISLFLFMYFLFTLMAVAVTSVETRHYGQFISCTLLLAIIPNMKNIRDMALVKNVALYWYGAIIIGYLMLYTIKTI